MINLKELPLGSIYSYADESQCATFGEINILIKKKARYEALSLTPHILPHYPAHEWSVNKMEADFYLPNTEECAIRLIDEMIYRHGGLIAMADKLTQSDYHHFPPGTFLLQRKFHLLLKTPTVYGVINLGTCKSERLTNDEIVARVYLPLEPVFYVK